MNPRDFLRLAERLSSGREEAEWRSGISRAYYAVFHIARRLLHCCGFDVPKGDQAHSFLWLRLAHSGQAEVQEAGTSLNTLRGRRNRADYDLDRSFHQLGATADVQSAKEIATILESAAKGPIKVRITEAMKTYERDVLKEVTWHS